MALDAIFITALTGELESKINGMKIDKVQQPERDVILLSLRGMGGAAKLYICAGAGNARIHITGLSYEQPQAPPMFCMLLRKHLQGSRISGLTQPEMERLVIIELDAFDELGDPVRKRLAVEMMGRSSNLILIGSDDRIIDCMRRVDFGMSGKRQVQPGLFYRLPPEQEKAPFFAETPDNIRRRWQSASEEAQADKWLLDTFSGLSPLVCRELCHRAFGDVSPRLCEIDPAARRGFPDVLAEFSRLVASGDFTPVMLLEDGKPREFCFMPVEQYAGALEGRVYNDFSGLLEDYYAKRDRLERMKRRAQAITKPVKTARDRTRRKLLAQAQELKNTADRDGLRRRGDIITSNLHRMQKGDTSLTAEDFYEEGCPRVTIELDPLKTPQQNAAAYYRDYNKAKSAKAHLETLIEQGERQLEYLESVLDEISRADGERELTEIRRELTETGVIKKQKQGKREKVQKSGPLRFVSDSGLEIYVGRNNTQNDELTFKAALRTDWWLHVQKIHGSHVIIRTGGRTPDETTLSQAASLAVYYSQARESGKTAVDYTQVRFVKKPAGALPGKVIYTDNKTVMAQADEALMERLKTK